MIQIDNSIELDLTGFDIDITGFEPPYDYVLTRTQAVCLRQYLDNILTAFDKQQFDRFIKADVQSSIDILTGLDRI